ncbi:MULTISPECIES: hypothetical protein [unclassified Aureimonas]|uniref:hypothetical protein n=1 Tax=unclassified Aureimonas TaxID=2615206 RepID=UPI0006F6B6C4|nr:MULTISPECIES: hypothetical protein [unclassified Aureimonas]KQT60365.1 hypothetical protein ASG62_06825 [Aureimonas sp. Leaf427]KQT79243.1 hypothetical protein ASG54_09425 [Aureimonas sp. Leaf460]
MSAINTMSVQAIRDRLAAIGRDERAFAARDLDAELATVMRNGGDADATEAAQQEAERVARRLRAERIALEGLLPEAILREGAEAMVRIKLRHDEAATEVDGVIDEMVESWNAFVNATQRFEKLQDEAFALTTQASNLAHETKAGMPQLGNFRSARLDAIGDLNNRKPILPILWSSQASAVTNHHGAQTRVID